MSGEYSVRPGMVKDEAAEIDINMHDFLRNGFYSLNGRRMLKGFEQYQNVLHLDRWFCVEWYYNTGDKGTYHRITSNISEKKIF